ncbi:MAG: PEP-utilizing enzyme [Patescibacteria group bacterium]
MAGAVIRSGEWRIKPSGKLPIFLRFMINSSFSHEIANQVGFKNHIVNRVYLNHMMYWPAKEYDAFETEIINNLKQDNYWLDNYCNRELKNSEELYNLGLKLQKTDWSKKSNLEMKKTLDSLLNKYKLLSCSWYAQYPIDIYYEDRIEEFLLKYIKISNSDFRKLVLIFTDPKEMTEVAEERWKLITIANKFKKNKEDLNNLSKSADNDLNNHLDRFAYINRGLATSKPYTRQDIIDRIKESLHSKEGLNKLINNSSPEKVKEDYNWALSQIKPEADFKRTIEQARLHSYTRNRRVEAFFRADFGASFMYHEIARRNKFNEDWVMELSVEEMYGALDGKILPDKTEMQRRFTNYAMVVEDAKTKLVVDPKEIKKLEEKYSVEIVDSNELQGKMASLGGIIRGRAKICLDKKDIGKIERGDILVAQFTTPDFVPAMEKAAAIVADQGGLSSHAAIVSRELGVPCVIDTKNGTRIIKDNDLLEINAQTGLVKILERAKE